MKSDKYKMTSTLRTDALQRALEDTLRRIAEDGEKPFLLSAKERYERELIRRGALTEERPGSDQPQG